MTVTAERIAYLDQFSDDALASMCQTDGYWNYFKGEAEFATFDELRAVIAYRAERDAKWQAELDEAEAKCFPKPEVSEHYANYLRYADKIHAENAGIFTASLQHSIPQYLPYAAYPKTPVMA